MKCVRYQCNAYDTKYEVLAIIREYDHFEKKNYGGLLINRPNCIIFSTFENFRTTSLQKVLSVCGLRTRDLNYIIVQVIEHRSCILARSDLNTFLIPEYSNEKMALIV